MMSRRFLSGMTFFSILLGSLIGYGCEPSSRAITGDQSTKSPSDGAEVLRPANDEDNGAAANETPDVLPENYVAIADKPSLKADDPEGKAALKKLGVEFDTDADGDVTEIKFPPKKIPAESWTLLKNFRSIEVLILDATSTGDADLAQLKDFPKLLELSLQENPVTDAGLAHLKGMKQLETLSLSKTRITGKGVASLAGLTKLKRLNLSHCPVGDAAMGHLKGMKDLETLALQKAGITGPGLEHVGKLKNMITLNLDETKLKGDSFLHLKGLSKLRIITFYDSEASASSIRKLESEISSLAIFQ